MKKQKCPGTPAFIGDTSGTERISASSSYQGQDCGDSLARFLSLHITRVVLLEHITGVVTASRET